MTGLVRQTSKDATTPRTFLLLLLPWFESGLIGARALTEPANLSFLNFVVFSFIKRIENPRPLNASKSTDPIQRLEFIMV